MKVRVLARRGLRLAVLAVVVWLAASFLVAHQLTRRSRVPFVEPAPVVAGVAVESHTLVTADGERLGAWFLPGRADRPPVLFLHGNGASRSDCLPEAEIAAADGSPVLLISLRAHGDSTGETNDFGYSARADVVAAVGFLNAKLPGRRVVIWGRSMGAAAALFAAADVGDRAAAYVLECPYRDLKTATRNRTRLVLPAGVEFVAYAGLRVVTPVILRDIDAISPLEAAAGVPPTLRVLVLAGADDALARPAEAQEIAAKLGPRAACVTIPGAGHVKLREADPTKYRTMILTELARHR